MLPPWLLRAQYCDSATHLSPRSPRCTGRCVSAESHVESWSTGVRVPRRRASPCRSRCSRLPTVYSVARTVGDPVRRTPRPATASPNTFRIRRSAPAYPKSHRGIEIFAPVHGGGLRAERIPTYLCEEVFSDTHFAAGAVFPLGISICWPDTMPDTVRPMLRSASSTWIRQPAAGRQGERRDSKRVGRERTTFDADSRLSFPPLSQPWHYVRSYPEEPLCWRSARRDEALSSLHFCFR